MKHLTDPQRYRYWLRYGIFTYEELLTFTHISDEEMKKILKSDLQSFQEDLIDRIQKKDAKDEIEPYVNNNGENGPPAKKKVTRKKTTRKKKNA